MAGETPVGGIVGHLRLDNDQFMRGIAEAMAAAERLDGKDVDVNVNVDRTGAAATQIARTERNLDKLDGTTKRVDQSSRSTSRGVGALATAIIALGPALVPVAAGAVGLGAAFGGMGAAGILAVVGVADEMKRGTAVGLTYKAGLDQGKAALMDLASVAAGNVLGSFQDVVRDLNGRLPGLRSQIGELSTVTGGAAAALAGGLLSAFQALEPLMRDASVYVLDLSTRFQTAMSGPGIVAFGDYVRSVFPQVMADVEAIVAAAAHLVAAFAPLGLGTLSMLRLLADVISAVPVDVLSALATTATSVFIGFRTWQGLSSLVAGFGGALERMGIQAGIASTAVRGLNIAAGVIGIALAAFSMIVSANAESQRAAEQATNDYADALRRSNGVVDESVRQMVAKKLSDDGVLESSRQLGLNLADVTSAALGNADAMARVTSSLDANGSAQRTVVATGGGVITINGKLADAADEVRASIDGSNSSLSSGIQKNKDLAAAAQSTSGTLTAQATAQQALAAQYGASSAVYQQVVTSQQGIADKAEAATLKMQLENDAAGILKQTLDALNGESLSAAEAQNAFESSLVNMGDHVTKTGKKVVFTTTSIKDMSSASVALRGQLNSQIGNLQRVVEANGGLADSTGKARAQMVTMRKQIIDNAVAHGVDRKAVTDYIDKILDIPKSVPPTKLDVDKKKADEKVDAIELKLDRLDKRVVTATVDVKTTVAQKLLDATTAKLNRLADRVVTTTVRQQTIGGGSGGGHGGGTGGAAHSPVGVAAGFPWGHYPSGGQHRAYDYPVPVGTPVRDPFGGKVLLTGWDPTGFGNHIRTVDSDGNYSIFGHLSRISVKMGQSISAGQVIGRSGNSGHSSGPHLHWERRHNVWDPNTSFRPYANGGITRQATIMRSQSPILWNEAPGGEAYIPLASSKRARSTAILEETNRALGSPLGGGSVSIDYDRLASAVASHMSGIGDLVEAGAARGTAAGLGFQARELSMGGRR